MAKISEAVTSYMTRTVSEMPEDVSSQIYAIDPSDTPFVSLAGTRKVTNTLFEWLTDDLTTASAGTPKEEGFQTVREASELTTRHNNYVQILTRNATVSGTQQSLKLLGKNSQMSYQMAKKAKELKRDVNYSIMHPQIKAAGSDPSTPRQSAMLNSWITTNVKSGTGGTVATGDGSDTYGNGTQRALTQDLINQCMQQCYQNGAEPNTILVGPFNKAVISTFGGREIARQMIDADRAGANIQIFTSDFGNLRVVPHRWQQERDCWLVDPKMVRIAYLRNYQTTELGRIGDGQTRQLLVEYGLQVDNEKAHGLVADLTTS